MSTTAEQPTRSPQTGVSRGTRSRAATIGAGAILSVLLLVVTACSAGAGDSGGGNPSGGAADQTLSIGLGAAPANLDMTQTAGAAIPQALMYNVYEGLVKLDGNADVQPLLAKSWKISDDGLSYDFTLQSGVKFSNGDPFDADVVKSNLDAVPDWKANTPTVLSAIKSVQAVSPTEVKINLKQPDNNLLFWLAGPLGAMFSPKAKDDLANSAIGTGPYLMDKYNRGESLILKRNDSYWGTKAKLSRATLRYYSDANAPVNALRSGDLDAVYQSQAADQVKQFQSDQQFTVQIGVTTGITVMSMNNAKPPFDDKRVRQAIIYGVDRNAVNTTSTNGLGKVLGGPVPPTDPWYTDLSKKYPYDPAKARQLLKAAGKSKLSVDFNVPSLPYAQTIAQVVKSDLAKIGVTANLHTQEFPAVWLDKTYTKHDYDLTVINHVEARNVFNYANPDYYWSYRNKAVQKELNDAVAAPDKEQFTSRMKTAVNGIVDDAAADWLYNAPNIVIAKKSVTGLGANDTGVSLDLTKTGNPS
ncbi:ABC transporter substrate-binding protein [Microlunatus soli]|uniref:Peptide/nickel transport system substrate-binding protein n=1 Tax=Microlunatus soli TaxID=630515 RepID=A0A1H2APS6_9ACTN|nr:ABC transporter substrate-binding protein [Microlunatus soli]SDT47914.1 peptide/nickel transport system substrate-binding protein [Microlunatus soli]